jgi:hypothetical protein
MKPDSNAQGSPFNFDAIPIWLYPDVWDEHKSVKLRGFWFLFLYTLSSLTFNGFIFLPIALFSGNWHKVFLIWLMFGVVGGVIVGLAVWWDFTKRARKLKALDK